MMPIFGECDIRSHMEGLQNETVYLLGMFEFIVFKIYFTDFCPHYWDKSTTNFHIYIIM